MKLQGIYNPAKTYAVNDVVMPEGNDVAYRLMHPAPAGTPPTDTQYWTRLSPELSECAQMIISYMVPAEAVTEAEPKKPARRKKDEKTND